MAPQIHSTLRVTELFSSTPSCCLRVRRRLHGLMLDLNIFTLTFKYLYTVFFHCTLTLSPLRAIFQKGFPYYSETGVAVCSGEKVKKKNLEYFLFSCNLVRWLFPKHSWMLTFGSLFHEWKKKTECLMPFCAKYRFCCFLVMFSSIRTWRQRLVRRQVEGHLWETSPLWTNRMENSRRNLVISQNLKTKTISVR